MESYIHPDFSRLLAHDGLSCFDDLWQLERNWFEPPNKRRSGTSGVCRKTWSDPATGAPSAFFLKFQENHCHREWRHPLAGSPTCHREAVNLSHFHGKGLPVQKLVYYHEQRRRGRVRAILATEELRGEDLVACLRRNGLDGAMIENLAQLIHQLHYKVGFEHRSLYPKHVWIQDDRPLLIDLEQARPWRWWRMGSCRDDLEVFVRQLRKKFDVPPSDCLTLVRRYLELSRKSAMLARLAGKYGLRE